MCSEVDGLWSDEKAELSWALFIHWNGEDHLHHSKGKTLIINWKEGSYIWKGEEYLHWKKGGEVKANEVIRREGCRGHCCG